MKVLTAAIGVLAVCSAVLASPTNEHNNIEKRAISTRIIGGKDASVSDYPFIAAITVRTSNTQYFCSGTLINSIWVLTSGQCVENAVTFTIQLGSSELTGDDENRVTLSASTSVIHPEYDPVTFENDIGLIKLPAPLSFTDYVKPIDALLNSTLPPYVDYIILGWGQTSDGSSGESNDLQEVGIVSVDDRKCKEVYGEYASDKIICVSGSYNEGTCIGDSGAPLVYKPFDGLDGWIHSGIASFMSRSGCESQDPSAFTRTEVYVDWIRNITSSEI